MSLEIMAAINLTELTRDEVRNLAGHDRGLRAREHFGLNELDESNETVDVLLPENFRAISPSFFQGMFAESVHHFGNVRAFFEHYHFDAPAHVRSRLIEYAEQAAGR